MAHTHTVDGLVSGKKFQAGTELLKRNKRFLTDEEYGGVALSSIVIACVDVALKCEGRFLLGFRKNEPYKGGWALPGGRMSPGESFGDTAKRHVAKLGLRMSPRRFRVVRSDSWAWSKRAQFPEDAGCHMQGTTVFAKISRREARRLTSGDDLKEILWLPAAEIFKNRKIHPSHKAAIRNVVSRHFQVGW